MQKHKRMLAGAYYAKRDELLQLLAENASIKEIAKHFQISETTAQKWKSRLLKEMQKNLEKKTQEIALEYFTRSMKQFELVEKMLLKKIREQYEKTDNRYNGAQAVYAFTKIKQAEMELLSRFNIIGKDTSTEVHVDLKQIQKELLTEKALPKDAS